MTNLECRLVLSSLRSLIIAVSWDTVECPSPDKVEHSDSRLTDELPFTSAEKVKKMYWWHFTCCTYKAKTL